MENCGCQVPRSHRNGPICARVRPFCQGWHCGSSWPWTAQRGATGAQRWRFESLPAPVWSRWLQTPDVRRCPHMTGHGAKFGRKMEQAVIAMLTARKMEEAAKSVGVSTKTLLRWQKLPQFDHAVPGGKNRHISTEPCAVTTGVRAGGDDAAKDPRRSQCAVVGQSPLCILHSG